MDVSSEDVWVDSSEGRFGAYLSSPTTPGRVGVVLIQEIFGVNANIRQACDSFARAGYPTIAPDLFWRQEPGLQLDPGSETGRARAVALMKQLDRDEAVADAGAALRTIRSRVPGVDRTAAIGYCFGGGVAYLLAVRNIVDAGIAYYGTYIHTMLEEADGLAGRLLLHIAENDHLCLPEAQSAIAAKLEGCGGGARIVVHEGVGHAFARTEGATFNQAAAERANTLTLETLAAVADGP